jgi:hypothetical protein
MTPHAHALPDLNRRRFLTGVGVAAAAGAVSPMLLASPAEAHHNRGRPWPVSPIPSPIPGGIDAPPVGFIHWWLPGPDGSSTPFNGIPGFGLDVDPSTLTNFDGFQAFAVASGEVRGSDGVTYDAEVDVRVFQGTYVAEDGSRNYGTFGFF